MITYVDMLFDVPKEEPKLNKELEFKTFDGLTKDDLFPIYYDCFKNSESPFLSQLTKEEHSGFYDNELGLPVALTYPLSHSVYLDNELIGYLFAIKHGDDNAHISCMCIKPHFQRKGYGRAMLDYACTQAIKLNLKTLTLGTEPVMSAYKLYEQYGFKVTKTHQFEQ